MALTLNWLQEYHSILHSVAVTTEDHTFPSSAGDLTEVRAPNCKCVCVCVCVCMCVRVYMYVCVYVHVYVCIYVCVYVHACDFINHMTNHMIAYLLVAVCRLSAVFQLC